MRPSGIHRSCDIHQGCHNRIPRLGGLNNRDVLSHGSGSWKSKIRVSGGLVSSVASLLGLSMAVLFLCLHTAFPFVCLCVLFL